MKIRYNNNEIEFTEQYRPEEITVNGVRASMNAYAEKHDGKNWQATASGNILYYLDDNGTSYAIPQKRFENIFQDELRELIQKTGMTMRAVAEAIDVPYRTMQHWRSGESIPNKFTQEVVKSEISKLFQTKEKKAMKIYTADREAGNKIEEFNTIEEAREAIAAYEEEDRKDGTYTPNFYDIVNEDCESII